MKGKEAGKSHCICQQEIERANRKHSHNYTSGMVLCIIPSQGKIPILGGVEDRSLQGAQMKSLLLQRIKLQFLVNHCQAIFFSQTQGGLEIRSVTARRKNEKRWERVSS